MDKTFINKLAHDWADAGRNVMLKRELKLSEMQTLIRDTYRVYFEYHDKEMMPKEMGKLSLNMNHFLDFLIRVFFHDEFEDNVHHDTFAFIVEAIEIGFYKGEYKYNYPMLKVDNCNGGEEVVNVEEDFLEFLIDSNR